MGSSLCGLSRPPYRADTPSPVGSASADTQKLPSSELPPLYTESKRPFSFTIRPFGDQKLKLRSLIVRNPPFPLDEIGLEPALYWDDEGARIKSIKGADYLIGSVILSVNGRPVCISSFSDIVLMLKDDTQAPFECVIQEGSHFESYCPSWSLEDILEHTKQNRVHLQKQIWDAVRPAGERDGSGIDSMVNVPGVNVDQKREEVRQMLEMDRPVYSLRQIRSIFEWLVNNYREVYSRITEPIECDGDVDPLAPFIYLLDKELRRWLKLFNPQFDQMEMMEQSEQANWVDLKDWPLFSVSDYWAFSNWLLYRIVETSSMNARKPVSSIRTRHPSVSEDMLPAGTIISQPSHKLRIEHEPGQRMSFVPLHSFFQARRYQIIAMLADCTAPNTTCVGTSMMVSNKLKPNDSHNDEIGENGDHKEQSSMEGSGSTSSISVEGKSITDQAQTEMIRRLFDSVDLFGKKQIHGDAIAVFFFLLLREYATTYSLMLRERRNKIKSESESGSTLINRDLLDYGKIPEVGLIPPSWTQIRSYVLMIYEDWKITTMRDTLYAFELSQLSVQLSMSVRRVQSGIRHSGMSHSTVEETAPLIRVGEPTDLSSAEGSTLVKKKRKKKKRKKKRRNKEKDSGLQ